MDATSVAGFVLVRVDADGNEEPVSGHASFSDGWSAGQEAVHADREGAYSLYRGNRRAAKFAHSRVANTTTNAEKEIPLLA